VIEMYELTFPDADPGAVHVYNQRNHPRDRAWPQLESTVDWGDTDYGDGVEVSIIFDEEPEDRFAQELLDVFGATAYHLRRLGQDEARR
jgi:hypothetical protein